MIRKYNEKAKNPKETILKIEEYSEGIKVIVCDEKGNWLWDLCHITDKGIYLNEDINKGDVTFPLDSNGSIKITNGN